MSISFVTWTRDQRKYDRLLDTLPEGSEAIQVGQDFVSLAAAYNHGTALASNDIICYVHEDVEILDRRFEKLAEKALENPKTGFAGPIGNLARSTYAWWDRKENNKGWVIQDNGKGGDVVLSFGAYDGPASQLDGLMLCTRHRFRFPEELEGIHAVDLWMCALAESQGLTNRIFSAAIKHWSWGEPDRTKYEPNYGIYLSRWPV